MPADIDSAPEITAMSNQERADAALIDVAQDWPQALISALVSNDVLKEIPVIKSFTAGAAVIGGVRDQYLMPKIDTFMKTLTEVPAEQRRSMIARLEADPAYRRKLGTHLIELLDRVDSHRKAGPTAVPILKCRVFGAARSLLAVEDLDL